MDKLLSTFLIREMSLAMYAASINDHSNITMSSNHSEDSDNILNQKRHKRTQRKYPKIEQFDNAKVTSVLQRIHENTEDDEEDAKDTFDPPPKPISSGVEKTIRESFSQNNDSSSFLGKAPKPHTDKRDDLELNDLNNYGDHTSNEMYYKKIMPGYEAQMQQQNQSYNPNPAPSPATTYNEPDVLLRKINYMISLLEEKQDEKTNNITEEVILYSFLGIFIIFLTDTFFRAGSKYRR